MISCACGIGSVDDKEFISHRTMMATMKSQKGKHYIVCTKCREKILPSFCYVFQACNKINSFLCDDCYNRMIARIQNDGYPPGKGPRR
jgi:hypothetical protein